MKKEIRKKFAKMLKSHDWSYQYSDDMRYYNAGAAQSKAIREFVNEHEEHRQELWTMYTERSPFTKFKDIMVRAVSRNHFKALPCGKYELSIQASAGHYCSPKQTYETAEGYYNFEVAINKRGGRMIKPRNSKVIKAFPRYDELGFDYKNQMVAGWIPEDVIQDLYDYLRRNGR